MITVSNEKYIADGKMIKCLFPFYTMWDWILRSLEDYVAYEQPYQITHWFVIDKNNNLKIYRKIYNTLHEGIYNSVSAMIEDSNIKYIVGPISKCYNMEYFIEYLTDNNIKFNKELDSEGKWKLFV